MKKSLSRVSIALMPGSLSITRLSSRATARVMTFSYVPEAPIEPGSSPPWPASIITRILRDAPGGTTLATVLTVSGCDFG
jgi:hypothetical protein